MKMKKYVAFAVLALAGIALPGDAQAGELVFGVTDEQRLVSWDSTAPGALLSGTSIMGLQNNERVVGIDFRPATGQLYALGSFSQLYTLNTTTGSATMVGPGPFTPAISGSNFGFDFNPVIDKIRLDSDTNANYVLDPDAGTATAVTDLFYGPGDPNENVDPNVVHAAYDRSFAGTTATQLYGVDTRLDVLVKQANSAGTLTTVGSIGTDVTATGGFDISGSSDVAYMAIENASTSFSTFWMVDLTTGVGSAVGEIGSGIVITSMAVAPVPEPAAALLAFGACAALLAGRRRTA
ncbi:hypothetical protein Pla123a_09740 [Posidoniimonas polymericola]|uniref:DUF4394 domain-containing protein n=1 Tax=Posidoniimonas polymericola TaxID=2528002 RepID=A0A5C5YT57_9BACT|nr:DUF4394 domain-containing protein [Posidoniimonas polymericola]TWT78184.1 hypothetical protein Pla123a_09740 [Posidoniimonas polymericola]